MRYSASGRRGSGSFGPGEPREAAEGNGAAGKVHLSRTRQKEMGKLIDPLSSFSSCPRISQSGEGRPGVAAPPFFVAARFFTFFSQKTSVKMLAAVITPLSWNANALPASASARRARLPAHRVPLWRLEVGRGG